MRRGIGGEPLEFKPNLAHQGHALDAKNVLAHSLFKPSADVPPLTSGGTASRTPRVGEAFSSSGAGHQDSQASKNAWFSSADASPAAEFLPPPSRPSASISQLTVILLLRLIMISATHQKNERERRSLSLSLIALLWGDS